MRRSRPCAPRSPTSTSAKATRTTPAARLWDDGLIDPADTRDTLGLCLALAARQDAPAPGPAIVYRM